MTRKISAPVGEKGTNLKPDVVTVQELLNGVPPEKGGPTPKLDVDGYAWGLTVAAIKRFQKVACRFQWPDGRVDPGQATIKKLNELNGEQPGSGPVSGDGRFVGFSPKRVAIVQEDVRIAKQLALSCTASLLLQVGFPRYDPDGRRMPIPFPQLDQEICELLMDTFAIDGSNLAQVRNVQVKYEDFPQIDTVKFIFSPDHPPNDHVAFTLIPDETLPKKEIFITEDYFASDLGEGNQPPITPQKERALTLIHEFIHLYVPAKDHPGSPEGGDFYFERKRMNIPYRQAKSNPLCYENYAKWLRQPR